MNRARAIAELASLQERTDFLNAVLDSTKPKPAPLPPYGCQEYDATRMCRFDRRAIDRKCDGCQRWTDEVELKRVGLWVAGVSHGSAA